MRLGTRLLLPLLPTVTLIMIIYAGWAQTERENRRAPEARREVQAYATALGLAFDLALRDARREDVQALLNEVSRAPAVYGILVYDSTGTQIIVTDLLRTAISAPAQLLNRVLKTGATVVFERELDEQRVYSLLRPLHGPGGEVTGALEIAQPSSLEEEMGLVRRQFLLNTVTLLAALSIAILWLVHRVVARPMKRLLGAARALGRGELGHRIAGDRSGGELAELAQEFNGMAHNLEVTRAAVVREAEERVALERRLREAEKMAAIGNLAAGLAHEIAAPLNVISGRAGMLRRELDLTTRDRNLSIIEHQISRITTIVRNLLGFAKRQEPQVRPIELGEVIDGVLELLEGELRRAGVTVSRDQPQPLWVRGDPDLLHQVLVNLILNAIQAMEAGEGRRALAIRIRPQRGDGEGSDRWAEVEIEDSGPGISDQVLPTLFEPFQTTKPRGTGLGLVVARRIVEEHEGRLEARNGAQGATFRILLPREPTSQGSGLSD